MGAVRGMSVSDSAVEADRRMPTDRNTAIPDMKAWTKQTGNELLSQQTGAKEYVFYMRKK